MSDTSEATPQPAVVQVDYLDSPEFHVDGLGGISVRNGLAKLNFFTVRHTKAGVEEPRGAVTLTISLADLIAMIGGLNGAVSQLQTQGVIALAQAGPQAEPVPEQQPEAYAEPQHEHHDHGNNDWH